MADGAQRVAAGVAGPDPPARAVSDLIARDRGRVAGSVRRDDADADAGLGFESIPKGGLAQNAPTADFAG